VPRFPTLRRPRGRETVNAEAYRILRSNLNIALLDLDRPSVLVTSARAGEGKTSTTVNLARALALAGHRVVLVDLDLRHPDAHHWLGTHNGLGVTDVLTRRRPLGECLQFVSFGESNATSDEGLYFLPTGDMVPNPAELLSSPRTPALLETLASQADVVLVDAPPVLPVADALVIGRMVGGAVLVVETRKTPVGAVQQAKDALTRSQTRLLGVVVNKFQPKDARSDQGYGYGDDYPHVSGRRSRAARGSPTTAPEDGLYIQPVPSVSPPATADEPTQTNGLSPGGDIDIPWPTASGPRISEPTVISRALPPSSPLRAVAGSEAAGPPEEFGGSDTGAIIDGNGFFDGAHPKRRFGRRR
jgi:capsular exopolysaccharide synthesis family protein